MTAPSNPLVNVLSCLTGVKKIGEQWHAICPAHDDTNPSLSISQGDDGRVLLYCHAGCELPSILAATKLELRDLFNSSSDSNSNEATTYDYRDESGVLLHQTCRFYPKKFRQRRPGEHGEWIWNLDGVRLVIYRLQDIVSSPPGARVFIVEGERDADRLHGLGLLATTNPMGAGAWRSEFNEPLRDKSVVIIPDNDKIGHEHAEDVARHMRSVTKAIRILFLPGLSKSGDVSDWLDAGGTLDQLEALLSDNEEIDGGDDSSEQGKASKNLAHRLVEVARSTDLLLFHDQRSDPCAEVHDGEHRRIVTVESREFGLWLRSLAWTVLKAAPASEVINTARQTLSSIALFEGDQHSLHVRCAWHEAAVWIDLDGNSAIQVQAVGWKLVRRPPILFRRLSFQKPLPVPRPGGKIRKVLEFVRIKDKRTQLLFLCYLVVAMLPETPIVVLIVHGDQGAAKTTLLKVAKRLLDPSAVEVRGGVKDQTEYAQAAAQNRVLYFDNLTSVPQWLSDALCRTVTGEGWSKRLLFTNEDTSFFEYQSVVGIGGINLVADRPDLLDRSLIIPLERVPKNQRKPEHKFWREFETARPEIIGGMLDVLARAMKIEPTLELAELPRMADFARWGAAAAVAMGYTAKEFVSAFDENVSRQNQAAVDASPVAEAVIELMRTHSRWEGSPGDLLEQLGSVARRTKINTTTKEWPKTANWLTRRIRDIRPNLGALGIEFSDARTEGGRTVVLEQGTPDPPPQPKDHDDKASTDDDTDVDSDMCNSLGNIGPDANDGNDDISGSSVIRRADPHAFEERAGILEFEAGYPRPEAERIAAELLNGRATQA